jgi:hypothetical protein
MSLLQKIGKTGALIGALAVGGYGCKPMTPEETQRAQERMLGLGLLGIGHEKESPGAAAVGRAMIDLNAAESGRSEINVNVGNNQPREKKSNGSHDRFIIDQIKKAEKDNLYLALWIDLNKDGISDRHDVYQDESTFYDGDRILHVRRTPKNYTGILHIRDSENKFLIIDKDEVKCEADASFNFGVMPVEYIKRFYSKPSGLKKIYYQLFNEGEDQPYASEEILIDFRDG